MRKLIVLILLFAGLGVHAQNHTIKGKINGLNPNDTVYLAQYLGKSLFYNDTSVVAKNGSFTFEGKPYEEGGKYAIVTPGPRLLEVLLDHHDLEFESDTTNLDHHMKVIESENNKTFYEYKRFLGKKNLERAPFDHVINDTLVPQEERDNAKEKVRELTQEVITYQKEVVEKNKDKLIGKLIKMTMDIEVPEAPEGVENEREWRYRYYREHYWDHVDLDDPRLVREQQFHRVLEKYLTSVLPQIPDTVAAEGAKLVDRVSKNYDMYKYTLHQLTYLTETSKVMCMDRAFVTIVNQYYKTGKVDWLTDEKLANIIEGADKKANTLCGEVAPNIILPDTTGQNWVNMHQVDAEYLVLAIWEPGCGHCKKEIPKLKAVYDKLKDKGVKVIGINNELENDDWMEFIEKENLDWINISDNPEINNSDSARSLLIERITTLNSLNFRSIYDVTSTPKIYLLDKEKEIIAKQLTAEQLEGMLDSFIKRDEEGKNDSMDQGFMKEE